jgi:hypothetical protein
VRQHLQPENCLDMLYKVTLSSDLDLQRVCVDVAAQRAPGLLHACDYMHACMPVNAGGWVGKELARAPACCWVGG